MNIVSKAIKEMNEKDVSALVVGIVTQLDEKPEETKQALRKNENYSKEILLAYHKIPGHDDAYCTMLKEIIRK